MVKKYKAKQNKAIDGLFICIRWIARSGSRSRSRSGEKKKAWKIGTANKNKELECILQHVQVRRASAFHRLRGPSSSSRSSAVVVHIHALHHSPLPGDISHKVRGGVREVLLGKSANCGIRIHSDALGACVVADVHRARGGASKDVAKQIFIEAKSAACVSSSLIGSPEINEGSRTRVLCVAVHRRRRDELIKSTTNRPQKPPCTMMHVEQQYSVMCGYFNDVRSDTLHPGLPDFSFSGTPMTHTAQRCVCVELPSPNTIISHLQHASVCNQVYTYVYTTTRCILQVQVPTQPTLQATHFKLDRHYTNTSSSCRLYEFNPSSLMRGKTGTNASCDPMYKLLYSLQYTSRTLRAG